MKYPEQLFILTQKGLFISAICKWLIDSLSFNKVHFLDYITQLFM